MLTSMELFTATSSRPISSCCPDGVVKVLDFGLAVGFSLPADSASWAGAIVGTPAYMAPEQAGGKPIDRRADVWAFGAVLFEMLSGRPVYLRKTALDTLAAIARDEPAWDSLPAETPASIVKLLRRCLDKDPKRRLRDIGEARVALEEDQPTPPAPNRFGAYAELDRGRKFLGLACAAVWIAWQRAGSFGARVDWKLSIVPPPGLELASVGSIYPSHTGDFARWHDDRLPPGRRPAIAQAQFHRVHPAGRHEGRGSTVLGS